jgi:hypothetical protein
METENRLPKGSRSHHPKASQRRQLVQHASGILPEVLTARSRQNDGTAGETPAARCGSHGFAVSQ